MAGRMQTPERLTLGAFGLVVLIGGSNFVAVRLSNRDLAPFFGAAIRFTLAAVLMFLYVKVKRIPLPRGRSLTGALIFGVLAFTGSYAFAYWALTKLSANAAGIVMASVPLLTFLMAMMHRIERFSWRGLGGALVALAGIAVMVGGSKARSLSVPHLLAMVGAAVCAAESGIVIKLFPPAHPFATNTVAMGTGSALLFALSGIAGENWTAPSTAGSWTVFLYLATVGSIGLFGLVLYTLKRWTASAVSYMFVLFPPVTALMAFLLAGEPLTRSVAAGGLVVMAGVWLGALSRPRTPAGQAQKPPTSAPVEEPAGG